VTRYTYDPFGNMTSQVRTVVNDPAFVDGELLV